jgi:signal transduction histidine kinase
MDFYLSQYSGPSLKLMVYHPIKDIWFYLLAAAVLAALAGYAWQYRRTPAALYWVLSLSLRAVWLLTLVMVTVTPVLADKVFWVKIQQMGALAIVPTFLLFVVNVAEIKARIIRPIILALVTVTAFSMLALLTTGWHGWFWRGVVWDGVTFGIIRGPIYWAVVGVAYFQFLLVMVLCVIWARRASGLRRWQILALPVDPLISITGHVLWAIDQQVGAIPPLPLAFMLSGVAWSVIFFRLRVLNLMPLAESTVIGNIDDSLIITDDQDYIMELNPSAERRFGDKAPALIGSYFPEVFACWPAMTALLAVTKAAEGEIHLEGSGDYSYHVTPLVIWGNLNIGKAIVLHDVTMLKQAQTQIIEQQKALSIAAERDRLRRELHDGSGQVWGYLKLQYQQLRDLVAEQRLTEADARLQKLMALNDDFHRGVRDSLAGLKTASGKGLAATLGEFMQWYENTYGIATSLDVAPDTAAQLSPADELQLLRIIQEAMANTRKHARAGLVRVSLRAADGQAAVVIEDDGCGFDAAAALAAGENRHGLAIMHERTGEIGGRLEIESAPGTGTRVTVWLPQDKGGRRRETAAGG